MIGSKLLLVLCVAMVALGGNVRGESLAELEAQFRARFEEQIEPVHQQRVKQLKDQYVKALNRALLSATGEGKLEEAVAVREEIARVLGGKALPENDEGVPEGLRRMQGTYRNQLGRLLETRAQAAGPLVKQFETALGELQVTLTKKGKLDEALAVKAYRTGGVAEKLLGAGMVPNSGKEIPGPAKVVRGAGEVTGVPERATTEMPFENSLGMRFVPVPITGGPSDGKTVLFCQHETRWGDYEAFAKRNRDVSDTWKNQTFDGFELEDDEEEHPVVNVSWEEAKAFCEWLSKKEGRTYRLPTDHEWSCAVGIGDQEDVSDLPETKNSVLKGVYPWGTQSLPSGVAGNFSDQSRREKAPGLHSAAYLDDYDDGFPTTAPVMSFTPNAQGICDLGGNVREWAEDWYNAAQDKRVVRGGSWSVGRQNFLSSSIRSFRTPGERSGYVGFRCVLEPGGGQ